MADCRWVTCFDCRATGRTSLSKAVVMPKEIREANRLKPVTALVELQDHLIPDHGIIIADDAKLKLNAQG
jgi:hypothetical protein